MTERPRLTDEEIERSWDAAWDQVKHQTGDGFQIRQAEVHPAFARRIEAVVLEQIRRDLQGWGNSDDPMAGPHAIERLGLSAGGSQVEKAGDLQGDGDAEMAGACNARTEPVEARRDNPAVSKPLDAPTAAKRDAARQPSKPSQVETAMQGGGCVNDNAGSRPGALPASRSEPSQDEAELERLIQRATDAHYCYHQMCINGEDRRCTDAADVRALGSLARRLLRERKKCIGLEHEDMIARLTTACAEARRLHDEHCSVRHIPGYPDCVPHWRPR